MLHDLPTDGATLTHPVSWEHRAGAWSFSCVPAAAPCSARHRMLQE